MFGRGELGAPLGIRDRNRNQLGELLEALLSVRWQAFAYPRDDHDAPEVALDRDRSGDNRREVVLPERVRDSTRDVFPAAPVRSGCPAGAVNPRGGHEPLERPACSYEDSAETAADADKDDRGPVGLEAADRRLGGEQPGDLVADGGENVVGPCSACCQRRDPPQRGLLIHEPAEPSVSVAPGIRHGRAMIAAQDGAGPRRPCPRHTLPVSETDYGRARVIIAEDDVLMREGLASLLQQAGYEVVGQAGDAPELTRLVRQRRPDLAIVDIRMPPAHKTEGLDAARIIRQEFPETAILILSAHVEVAHAMTLLASGGRSGYLLKSRIADLAEFLDAVKRVCRGGSVVDPSLVQELIATRDIDDPLEELTRRERDVLALMAEGRSNTGIGRRLWITEGTVEKHISSIMMKLRLPETDDDHRRVLAVITFLDAHQTA